MTTNAPNPLASSAKGKVLVILSSSDHVTLEGGITKPTGFFLNELATPVSKLIESGWAVEFANPLGTLPATDPVSQSVMFFLGSTATRDKNQQLIERMKVESNFARPQKFSDISDEQLEDYLGVFIPGGHAPMEDLHNDKDLGRILVYFHRARKPIGAICHGPIAFLSALELGGKFPWETYKMTGYSNTEEMMNELKWMHKLKLHVESELAKHGVLFHKSLLPLTSHIEEDRELVTGQNPGSAEAFAEKFVAKLDRWLVTGGKEEARRRSSVGRVVGIQPPEVPGMVPPPAGNTMPAP